MAASVALPFQMLEEFQIHTYRITFLLELHQSPLLGAFHFLH